MTIDELHKAEEAIYKREFTAEQRRKLASERKALPDGSYPIETAADLKAAAVLARSGHGDVAAARALIARRAKELGVRNPLDGEEMSKSEVSLEVKLIKGEFEGKVYGVVLTPGLPDSQGDIATEEDIEKACHEFMQDYQQPDLQHSGRDAGARLIENAIAPQDFTIGGETVLKGAWWQAYQVDDPVVKQEIAEGKWTGFSLEGTGLRLPLAA